MRNLGCLLAITAVSLSGQTVFDFEDDSLSGWIQRPEVRWECATKDPIAGAFSLYHAYDNPASGVDHISRELQYPDLSDTLSVAFRVRHQYPPSSGNNWQLFFLASRYRQPAENKFFNSALIFGVNYSGYDDHLKLWHLQDGDAIEILDTGLDYQEEIGTAGEPMFLITRFPGGRWEVKCQISGDADTLQSLGEGIEIEPLRGKYVGFRYSYSSSQDRKLWLDDITVQGRFYRDTIPPRIKGVRILGLNGLEIRYNEHVRLNDQYRYSWSQLEPDSLFLAPDLHRIYFNQPYPNRKVVELHVSGIKDLENNVLRDTILHVKQDLAAFGDIVINEIMTDPAPPVYLPGCEFVELLNRYDMPIDLAGWHLIVNSREYDIQAATLQPGDYLLLTHPDCNGKYGNIKHQAVLTSSTALVNGGAVVQLTDRYGRIIHYLEYEEMERYGDDKKDGGWSLERTDPDNLCGGAENWRISISGKGGTPGKVNSHQTAVPDFSPPHIIGLGVPANHQIHILFNETVFLSGENDARFLVGDRPAIPVTGGSAFAGRELMLLPDITLDSSVLYQIVLENIPDCAGNHAEDQRIPFMLPSAPAPGVPVINEIMYDPFPGCNEYIELYNQGKHYVDLFELQLEIREPGTMSGTRVPLSEGSRLLFPGQYAVFCKHDYALRSEWISREDISVIGRDGWRQLPENGACIRLTDRSGRPIDQVCYHDSMHHDLLEVSSGVALERIDPDCMAGSYCWTSAAASENYGTPGSKNSQAMVAETTAQYLHLNPKVFSPDGDGADDVLQISVGRLTEGSIIDLFVTDLSGNLIRQIISNGIVGSDDHFYWNGKDQQGYIIPAGIYIIHLRSVSVPVRQVQRSACAVVYR